MPASVQKKFPGQFFLDEERIRHIDELINKGVSEIEEDNICKFIVTRRGGYEYTTDDLEALIKDKNITHERIKSLEILASSQTKDACYLNLTFGDDEDGFSLNLHGSDDGRIYLIFSELAAYLESEVKMRFRTNFIVILIFSIAVTIAVGVALFYPNTDTVTFVTQEEIRAAIESNGLEEKLNVLLRQYLQSEPAKFNLGDLVVPVVGLSVVLGALVSVGEVKINRFLLRNWFNIGKQIAVREKQKKIFRYIGGTFFSVILAIFVTITFSDIKLSDLI